MLHTKFQANWPFGSGEEVKNRFSRWPPQWPSWISDWNGFCYFLSASHPNASFQVSSQFACLAEDSHEMLRLVFSKKKKKNIECRLLQILLGALRVKIKILGAIVPEKFVTKKKFTDRHKPGKVKHYIPLAYYVCRGYNY